MSKITQLGLFDFRAFLNIGMLLAALFDRTMREVELLLNENLLSLYRHKPMPYNDDEEECYLLTAAEDSAEYGKK